MALKIGVVSQKGGVGKSTLCRLIACEYARNGWNVKIAIAQSSHEAPSFSNQSAKGPSKNQQCANAADSFPQAYSSGIGLNNNRAVRVNDTTKQIWINERLDQEQPRSIGNKG